MQKLTRYSSRRPSKLFPGVPFSPACLSRSLLIKNRTRSTILSAFILLTSIYPQAALAQYCSQFDGVGPCAVFGVFAAGDLRPVMNAGNQLGPRAESVDTAPSWVTFNGNQSVGACQPSTTGGSFCFTHYAIDIWDWTTGDGGGASGISYTHLYPDAGTFSVDLNVSSAGELDLSADVMIIPSNTTPVLDPDLAWEEQFQWSPHRTSTAYDAVTGQVVDFTIRIESIDPFQEIYVEWDWDGDGVVDELTGPIAPPIPEFPDSVPFVVSASHAYDLAGTFTPSLRLYDSKYREFGDLYVESLLGLSGWYTRSSSPDGPTLIVVEASASGADVFPRPAWVDMPVTLYARDESPIVFTEFQWDIGSDGTIDVVVPVDASGNSAQGWHTFTAEGVYPLRVRSVDNVGSFGDWIDVEPLPVVDNQCVGDNDGDGVPCWADWDDTIADDPPSLIRVRLSGPGLLADLFDDGLATTAPLDMFWFSLFGWTGFTGLWFFTDIDIVSGSLIKEGFINLWAKHAGVGCGPFGPCDTAYLSGVGLCYELDPLTFGFCEYRAIIDDDKGTFDFLDNVSIDARWGDHRFEYSGDIVPFVGGDIHVEIEE